MPINLLSHQPTILSTLFAAHKASKYKNTWRARGRERASAGCGGTHRTLRFPPRLISTHFSLLFIYLSSISHHHGTTAPLPLLSPLTPQPLPQPRQEAGRDGCTQGVVPGGAQRRLLPRLQQGYFRPAQRLDLCLFRCLLFLDRCMSLSSCFSGLMPSPLVSRVFRPFWCFLDPFRLTQTVTFGFQEDCNGRERNF